VGFLVNKVAFRIFTLSPVIVSPPVLNPPSKLKNRSNVSCNINETRDTEIATEDNGLLLKRPIVDATEDNGLLLRGQIVGATEDNGLLLRRPIVGATEDNGLLLRRQILSDLPIYFLFFSLMSFLWNYTSLTILLLPTLIQFACRCKLKWLPQ
jgi:hypothetical protein